MPLNEVEEAIAADSEVVVPGPAMPSANLLVELLNNSLSDIGAMRAKGPVTVREPHGAA
tara:strand:+ start:11637 stop:11813 length:177 start_codon:yes stop_codon:yes gene_type:complete